MPKRRGWAILFFVLTCNTVAFAGCAATRQSVGGWFGGEEATSKDDAESSARVYYAGADRLTLYSEPSASSKVIRRLALHERVTRFKLEQGYAYVQTDSGEKGWVDNGQLIWRLPSAPTTTAPAVPRIEEPAAEESQEQRVTQPTATATEPSPARTNAPTPGPTPGGVEPSIFDAY
jgi:hypothetical protein